MNYLLNAKSSGLGNSQNETITRKELLQHVATLRILGWDITIIHLFSGAVRISGSYRSHRITARLTPISQEVAA